LTKHTHRGTAAPPSAAGQARENLPTQQVAAVYIPSTYSAMKRKTEIVSFRADASLLARIDKAREPLSLSRGDWLRELAIAHFHEDESAADMPAQLADLRLALDEITQLLAPIASNQKRSLFIVLTAVGKFDPEQAKEIIRCKLQS
jgi:hypothetical protein